jgi:glycosyltransferase involved in cell wall biosynthesis
MVLSIAEALHARKVRPRIVFVTAPTLGFATFDRNIREALIDNTVADTIHMSLVTPLAQKIFSKRFAREPQILSSAIRRRLAWLYHVPRLTRILRDLDADVFHVTPPFLGLLAVSASRATGVPFGVGLDVTIRLSHPGLVRPVDRAVDAVDQRTLAHAALVAPFSRWAATSLREDYGTRNMVITPPAIRVASAVTRVPGRTGPPRVAYIGNDWIRKGGDRLVRWHQRYFVDAELHLVGRDVPRGCAPNVISHGPLPSETVLTRFLPSVDVLCLPTTNDMSPQTLVEAAAAGVPAVTSRLAGLPELVLHGRTGIICGVDAEPEWISALIRLTSDPSLVSAYGQAARLHALATFERDVVFSRLVDRLVEAAHRSTQRNGPA